MRRLLVAVNADTLHGAAHSLTAFPLVSVLRTRLVLVTFDDTPDRRAPKAGRRVDDGFAANCAEMRRDLAGIKAVLEKLADTLQILTAARPRAQP